MNPTQAITSTGRHLATIKGLTENPSMSDAQKIEQIKKEVEQATACIDLVENVLLSPDGFNNGGREIMIKLIALNEKLTTKTNHK